MSAQTGKVPQKKASGVSSRKSNERIFPFTRENYIYMLIGLGVILLGYLLMIGGRSPNPDQFHPDQVYSFRRITLSPIIIIIGFLIEVYAIMKKPKKEQPAES